MDQAQGDALEHDLEADHLLDRAAPRQQAEQADQEQHHAERCVQRIANIETSGTTNIFDEDQLIGAINNLPDGGADPSTTIFVTRSIKTQLDIRAKDKNNVRYGSSEVWGENVTMFRGVPVVMSEVMTDTETAVS